MRIKSILLKKIIKRVIRVMITIGIIRIGSTVYIKFFLTNVFKILNSLS